MDESHCEEDSIEFSTKGAGSLVVLLITYLWTAAATRSSTESRQFIAGMLTRPAGHEAEARKSEAEAEAQKIFWGRGHNVWGRGQTH